MSTLYFHHQKQLTYISEVRVCHDVPHIRHASGDDDLPLSFHCPGFILVLTDLNVTIGLSAGPDGRAPAKPTGPAVQERFYANSSWSHIAL